MAISIEKIHTVFRILMMPSMRTQSNIYERAIVWSAAYMEEGTGSYYLSLKWIVYFLST